MYEELHTHTQTQYENNRTIEGCRHRLSIPDKAVKAKRYGYLKTERRSFSWNVRINWFVESHWPEDEKRTEKGLRMKGKQLNWNSFPTTSSCSFATLVSRVKFIHLTLQDIVMYGIIPNSSSNLKLLPLHRPYVFHKL